MIVTDATDARAASEGGADRLELVAEPERGGMTPAPQVVHDVLAETQLPVRVMIRRTESHRLTETTAQLLRSDVESLSMATEFVCGAIDAPGVPAAALDSVISAMSGRRWTFHRALDDAPDLPSALTAALFLPGCDHVLTAGHADGVDAGIPRLTSMLHDRELAPAVLVGGGVNRDNVHTLLAAGAQGIHLGRVAREGASWGGPVSADLVREVADLVHAS